MTSLAQCYERDETTLSVNPYDFCSLFVSAHSECLICEPHSWILFRFEMAACALAGKGEVPYVARAQTMNSPDNF